jgi:hypothetical protein
MVNSSRDDVAPTWDQVTALYLNHSPSVKMYHPTIIMEMKASMQVCKNYWTMKSHVRHSLMMNLAYVVVDVVDVVVLAVVVGDVQDRDVVIHSVVVNQRHDARLHVVCYYY